MDPTKDIPANEGKSERKEEVEKKDLNPQPSYFSRREKGTLTSGLQPLPLITYYYQCSTTVLYNHWPSKLIDTSVNLVFGKSENRSRLLVAAHLDEQPRLLSVFLF